MAAAAGFTDFLVAAAVSVTANAVIVADALIADAILYATLPLVTARSSGPIPYVLEVEAPSTVSD